MPRLVCLNALGCVFAVVAPAAAAPLPDQQPDLTTRVARVSLAWPIALQELGPKAETQQLRRRIETLLGAIQSENGSGGQSSQAMLNDFDDSLRKLHGRLKLAVNDWSFNQFTEAKRFLVQLSDSAHGRSAPVPPGDGK